MYPGGRSWLKPMGHLNVPRWQIKTLISLLRTAYWDCLLGLLIGTASLTFKAYETVPVISRPMTSHFKDYETVPVISRPMKQSQTFQRLCMKLYEVISQFRNCFSLIHRIMQFFDKEINTLYFRYGDGNTFESQSVWQKVHCCGSVWTFAVVQCRIHHTSLTVRTERGAENSLEKLGNY